MVSCSLALIPRTEASQPGESRLAPTTLTRTAPARNAGTPPRRRAQPGERKRATRLANGAKLALQGDETRDEDRQPRGTGPGLDDRPPMKLLATLALLAGTHSTPAAHQEQFDFERDRVLLRDGRELRGVVLQQYA